MKKVLIALVATLVAVSVAGCVGVGKGKAPPPIVTKGWSDKLLCGCFAGLGIVGAPVWWRPTMSAAHGKPVRWAERV